MPQRTKSIINWGRYRSFITVFLFIATLFLSCDAFEPKGRDSVSDDTQETRDEPDDTTATTSNNNNKERRILSLTESLRQSFYHPDASSVRRQYWRNVFDEIRNFTGSSFNMTSQHDNAKQPRFEGFISWDRLLQEWSEEIQEYLDNVQAETGEGYSMSNYGRATTTTTSKSESSKSSGSSTESYEDLASMTNQTVPAILEDSSNSTVTTKKQRLDLPIPAPAEPGEEVLPHTQISDKSKRILIVTTASLPWKTGTAVNPLLRAAYLLEGRPEAGGSVTLMLPWLERTVDQNRVYGEGNTFASPADQEQYIRTWLLESANMKQASEKLVIQWYTAWQNPVENSIYSMGDITALIPSDSIDICILEEPEHLNWYRAPGESWTSKFEHVVGILHTNYFSYALDQPAALIRAPAMKLLCSWMCRAHCHRVVKLSGTLDKVAPEKELVENVHGVRETFLDVGKEVAKRLKNKSDPVFSATAEPSVYYIGKLLWSKGLGSLMELLKYAEESAELKVKVDMYGGGPDKEAAEAKAQGLGLDMPFHGPIDHGELGFQHKIFVNPSTSEVLCTTSAEALAMGKFVILPSHPSNDFFTQFPNCLPYTTKEEFVGNLYYALTHAPEALTEEASYALTWKAATERLEAAGCIPKREAELMEEAIKSKEARVEIALPPLVGENREALLKNFRNSRERYRQFRLRLSNEVQRSRVLPKPLRERLQRELDKRLDLDIDEIFESPRLRLQLSPAELDKSLLELYNSVSESPSGDILRVIGGGGRIGLQNFYMKRQASKQRKNKSYNAFPDIVEEVYIEEKNLTPSEWVRMALTTNYSKAKRRQFDQIRPPNSKGGDNTFKMCREKPAFSTISRLSSWDGLRAPVSFHRPKSRSQTFSLLI